jgi:tetratricopeptide (TPR) repeat protein
MIRTTEHRLVLICIAVIFSCCTLTVSASSTAKADSIVSAGNAYYMNHDYNMAATCYKQVVDMGFVAADLYYNLGNAYYKQNRMAEAILYYEKALLLTPGNDDIRQNLAMANARIVDKINDIPDLFLKRWINSLGGSLLPDQWAVASLALFVIALVAFLVYRFSESLRTRKLGFTTGIILILLSTACFLFMQSRDQAIRNSHKAIIMAPSVNVKSSPDVQSTNVFVLHEGTRVVLTDSVKDWKEIRIGDGNKGWVLGEVLGGI